MEIDYQFLILILTIVICAGGISSCIFNYEKDRNSYLENIAGTIIFSIIYSILIAIIIWIYFAFQAWG